LWVRLLTVVLQPSASAASSGGGGRASGRKTIRGPVPRGETDAGGGGEEPAGRAETAVSSTSLKDKGRRCCRTSQKAESHNPNVGPCCTPLPAQRETLTLVEQRKTWPPGSG
jgi:hypothetical protein